MPAKEPTPPLLTLGAEFEAALVYRKFPNGEDMTETLFKEVGCPPEFKIELPPDAMDTAPEELWVRRRCEDAVMDVLRAAGLDEKVKIEVDEPDQTLELDRLKPFYTWGIKDDQSIFAHYVHGIDPRLSVLRLEINTPMFHDSSEAYDLLRFAVNLITSRFLLTVNPSCGLHVHVGNGASWFSHEEIRRIGSLCWVASNILACLHSPIRMISQYAPPLRTCSNMGSLSWEYQDFKIDHGQSLMDPPEFKCHRYIANGVRFGERPLLWRETHAGFSTMDAFAETRMPGVSAPFIDDDAPLTLGKITQWPNHVKECNQPALLPQSSPSSYEYGYPERIEGGHERPQDWDQEPNWTNPPYSGEIEPQDDIAQRVAPPSVGVFPPRPSRLSKIPRLKRPRLDDHDVQQLQGIMNDKYEAGDGDQDPHLGEDPWGVWGGVNRLYQSKSACEVGFLLYSASRPAYNMNIYSFCDDMSDMSQSMMQKKTVEWRQADGSMDAMWVYTYLRIVVGTVRFAIQASVADFLNVVSNCQNFEEGGSYDVVDFLEEIGLVTEAKAAAKRLHQNQTGWKREYEGRADPDSALTKRSGHDGDEDGGSSKKGKFHSSGEDEDVMGADDGHENDDGNSG